MDSYRNGALSICGLNAAAEESNDDKSAICYLELRDPLVCGRQLVDIDSVVTV